MNFRRAPYGDGKNDIVVGNTGLIRTLSYNEEEVLELGQTLLIEDIFPGSQINELQVGDYDG